MFAKLKVRYYIDYNRKIMKIFFQLHAKNLQKSPL